MLDTANEPLCGETSGRCIRYWNDTCLNLQDIYQKYIDYKYIDYFYPKIRSN
jgi:hypothetical protein